MKIALCDFDDRYLNSLLTYLYGKCGRESFSTFTTTEDFEAAVSNNKYDYIIMGDEFYDRLKECGDGEASGEIAKADLTAGGLIILSSTIDNLRSDDESVLTIYKYGPMDGLYRMMTHKNVQTSDSRKYAVYSPTHHELTEMYGLSMCQMLSESRKVLLIDTMYCPVVRRLIRDGPRGGLVDAIYKLENGKSEEIRDLIEEYSGIDVFPMGLSITDVASLNKNQWQMLIDYADSLNYETYLFIVEDINQGFKAIMEYADSCILINKKGDYYRDVQDSVRDYIKGVGTAATSVELLMSANNLTEGCYQLEELLTGNLGRYVRAQKYG